MRQKKKLSFLSRQSNPHLMRKEASINLKCKEIEESKEGEDARGLINSQCKNAFSLHPVIENELWNAIYKVNCINRRLYVKTTSDGDSFHLSHPSDNGMQHERHLILQNSFDYIFHRVFLTCFFFVISVDLSSSLTLHSHLIFIYGNVSQPNPLKIKFQL